MPVDWSRYPTNWKTFTTQIKIHRANLRCECIGQCGLHGGKTAGRRCVEVHGEPARWARGKIILTVAHLCQCSPPCADPAHVIAACQRCHLRIDRAQHVATRRARLAERGLRYNDCLKHPAPPPQRHQKRNRGHQDERSKTA